MVRLTLIIITSLFLFMPFLQGCSVLVESAVTRDFPPQANKLKTKISLKLKNVGLEKALQTIGRMAKLEIVVDKSIYEQFEPEELIVSIEAENLSVQEILNRPLKDKLNFILRKGVLIVSAPKKIAELREDKAKPEERSWEDAWVVETKHFIVRTNTEIELAHKIGKMSESFINEFTKYFGLPKGVKEVQFNKKLQIFLFKNYEEYLDHAGSQGMNISSGDTIFTSDAVPRVRVFKRVRHELAHHFLYYRITGEAVHESEVRLYGFSWLPRCIDEGIAVYFEQVKGSNGFNPKYLFMVKKTIGSNKEPILEWLMNIGFSEFYEGDVKDEARMSRYRLSWSLIYFLFNAKGMEGALKEYIHQLRERPDSPVEVFQKIIKGVNLDGEKLEQAWRNFIYTQWEQWMEKNKESLLQDKEKIQQIEKLITDLGNDEWQIREQATDELIKLDPICFPFILEALKSPDPEVQLRARHILGRVFESKER